MFADRVRCSLLLVLETTCTFASCAILKRTEEMIWKRYRSMSTSGNEQDKARLLSPTVAINI